MKLEEINELKALLAKATPGPWERAWGNDTGPNDDYYVEWDEVGPVQVHGKNSSADADLITAMHAALPRLLALAERVEASPVGDVGIDDGDLVFVRVPDGVNRPNFQGQPVRLLVVEGGE